MKAIQGVASTLRLYAKPIVHRAYRKFVKGFPCCGCGKNWWVDAAHTGDHATGAKASDLDVIPLCRICHDLYHDIGRLKFEAVKALVIATIIATLHRRAEACGLDLSRTDSPRKVTKRSRRL